MFRRTLASLAAGLGLLTLSAGSAMANDVTMASATMTCSTYSLTLSADMLAYGYTGYDIDYTIDFAPGPGSPPVSPITGSIPIPGGAINPATGTYGPVTVTGSFPMLVGTYTFSGSAYVSVPPTQGGPGPALAITFSPSSETCPSTTPPPSTCSATSIQSNFNGTCIPAGDDIWFSAVLKVQGLPSTGGTVSFTGSTISVDGTTLSVPNGTVTFVPNGTSATTTYNAATGTWTTIVPTNSSGNAFLTGVEFPVPAGFPCGGVSPTWTGSFSAPAGVTINWQWAAAVYTSFSTDYNALGVKATDDNHYPPYANSDHAGTPENYKSYVTGGAQGGGGGNYTGSLSGTSSSQCQ